MKIYLQQLENNEAILLMYLADELPAQDRAEVEEMLASDPRLQLELENLRLTHQLAFDALESLDSITRPPLSPIAAQNQLSQILRQWLERNRKPAAGNSASRSQFPWLRSSFAAAASLMIGYYIWLVYHAVGPVPLAQRPDARPLPDNEKVDILYSSLSSDESKTDDDSNLRVAEVASIARADVPDSAESASAPDSNTTGAP